MKSNDSSHQDMALKSIKPLLLGPLLFPRSFLTLLVILGIFVKWYWLNQPMSCLLKWLAITKIDSLLRSEGFLGWVKLQLALYEDGENLIKHVLREHVQLIDRDIYEIECSQFSLLFGGSIHHHHATKHLQPLMRGSFFHTPIRGSWVALIPMVLFGVWVLIRIRKGCTICKWRLIFFCFDSACLGVVPQRYSLSCNNPWYYHDWSHRSLTQVDLLTKRLHDFYGTN